MSSVTPVFKAPVGVYVKYGRRYRKMWHPDAEVHVTPYAVAA